MTDKGNITCAKNIDRWGAPPLVAFHLSRGRQKRLEPAASRRTASLAYIFQ